MKNDDVLKYYRGQQFIYVHDKVHLIFTTTKYNVNDKFHDIV